MAGHDLRQPLQLISNVHEVLGAMLRSVEQQHKLVQAADATARLTPRLGQLVDALQRHSQQHRRNTFGGLSRHVAPDRCGSRSLAKEGQRHDRLA